MGRPGRGGVSYDEAIDRNSPCSIVDPQDPGSPNRGLLVGAVTLARSAAAASSTPVVAAICAAEILGLAGFSIIPALLPQFIDAWALTNTQAGWLAGIVSAGYMLAVIPLVRPRLRLPPAPARLIHHCHEGGETEFFNGIL